MITQTLIQNGLTASIKNGLLGVSPKKLLTDDLREFISRNKSQIIIELREAKLNSLLLENDELQEQFNFEVEERTAIMIFDGEINETEAERLALRNTLENWLSLFGE